MSKLEGRCLCGAVKYKVNADPMVVANCHCTDCRRSTGAAYATLLFVKESDIEITGQTKSFEHLSDRGSKMTKHFCPECGSPMFTLNAAREGMVGFRVGSLEDASAIKPMRNVYMSSRIPSTPVDPELPASEKMPG